MTAVKWEDLPPQAQEQVRSQLAPKQEKGNGTQKPKAENTAGNLRSRFKTRRPLHVWFFVACVAVLAYALLALGWVIGVIGDSIYEVGARLHEDKWGIR